MKHTHVKEHGAIHIDHPGALHVRLGYKEGEKIPEGVIEHDLAKAKKEHNTKDIKQDVFALNFGHKK